MNKNQLAKLNIQINQLKLKIKQKETQFAQATGVNKTRKADELRVLKEQLNTLKSQLKDGTRKDAQKTAEAGIKKTTKENESLETIKEEKTTELETKKQKDIADKNFKTALDAVAALYASMAEVPTQKDLDGLKSEIENLMPDLSSDHLRSTYRSRVDERYKQRSAEFEKIRKAELKEANTVDETIEELDDTEVDLSSFSTEKLQELLKDENTSESVKKQISNLLKNQKIERESGSEEEGTFNITEAGTLEVVKDGKWTLFTGKYGDKEYVNGVTVGGDERVEESAEFGTEYQKKLDAENKVLNQENTKLRTEIFNLIASIRGLIGKMDSAETLDELNSIWGEIQTQLDSMEKGA